MSTSTDYRTRELAKRDRQTARRTGRANKGAQVAAFGTIVKNADSLDSGKNPGFYAGLTKGKK